jgi:hypothetical protein
MAFHFFRARFGSCIPKIIDKEFYSPQECIHSCHWDLQRIWRLNRVEKHRRVKAINVFSDVAALFEEIHQTILRNGNSQQQKIEFSKGFFGY